MTNGHNIFDDFAGVGYTANATVQYTLVGLAVASGTGALVRNENPMNQGNGTLGLSTGTAITGNGTIKSQPRGPWNFTTGGGASRLCVLTRLQLTTATPSTAESYIAQMGVSLGALSGGVATSGALSWIADTNSSFWQCRASNNANTIVNVTVSSLPLSLNPVVLGCWYPNNLGDCVFFYSADGGTVYTVNSRFVRVSSTYGGVPIVGINKSAGTTNRTMDLDYIAISKKGGLV